VGNKRSSSSSSSSPSSSPSPSSRSKVQKKPVAQEKRPSGEEEAANAVVELADAELVDDERDDRQGCRDCDRLLRDLQRHVTDHHAESGVAIQKAIGS
jgi:hypothetical protein